MTHLLIFIAKETVADRMNEMLSECAKMGEPILKSQKYVLVAISAN